MMVLGSCVIGVRSECSGLFKVIKVTHTHIFTCVCEPSPKTALIDPRSRPIHYLIFTQIRKKRKKCWC